MSHNLTPAQIERLVKLQEEMNEAGKELCKILQHGYVATTPAGVTYDNRTALQRELGDVCAAIRLLTDSEDLDDGKIHDAAVAKDQIITQHMHHQGPEREWILRTARQLYASEPNISNKYGAWADTPGFIKDDYFKRARALANVRTGEQNA